jgi:hypothetical protein
VHQSLEDTDVQEGKGQGGKNPWGNKTPPGKDHMPQLQFSLGKSRPDTANQTRFG